MLHVLLAKDLRRFMHNPMPWLIQLLIPLAMTGLIGLAFGPRHSRGRLGLIRFAIVDEDRTILAEMIKGMADHHRWRDDLEPVFLSRKEAMAQITANKLSAVIVIPANFAKDCLVGRPTRIELIKNPAQSIHPAVIQEALGAIVSGINAVLPVIGPDANEISGLFDGKSNFLQTTSLINRLADRFKVIGPYVDPPIVSYDRQSKDDKGPVGPMFNLFGHLLSGLSAMFLLFLACNTMSDLHAELQMRTFRRYYTIRHDLLTFVISKVALTVVMLGIGGLVMLGGGSLIFRLHWANPAGPMALLFGYSCFASGLVAAIAALLADGRLAVVFGNLAAMVLGLVGGCAFPLENMPSFLRYHISPYLPTYWFTQALRSLQGSGAVMAWPIASVRLVAIGAALAIVAACAFRWRFRMEGSI